MIQETAVLKLKYSQLMRSIFNLALTLTLLDSISIIDSKFLLTLSLTISRQDSVFKKTRKLALSGFSQ